MPDSSQPRYHRRSIRKQEHDYQTPGAYFITICVSNRQRLFGEITDKVMKLSPLGEVVKTEWEQLPERFSNTELGSYSILPDHFHGILYLTENSDHEPEVRRFGGMVPNSIPSIIRSFKSSVSFRASILNLPVDHIWQRNYYERIIRSQDELAKITDYIDANVENFEKDPYW